MSLRYVAVGVGLVAACAPVGDGESIDACAKDCGPGALRRGRYIALDGSVAIAANATGMTARGAGDRLAWLAADFTTTETTSFDYVGGTSGGSISHLSVDDRGGAYLTYTSHDDFDSFTALIALDRDHRQRWRYELGKGIEYIRVGGGPALALVTGDRFAIAGQPIDAATIVALHADDGTIAWVKHGLTASQIKTLSDGTVIVGGAFTGTLALGGAVAPLVATGTADGVLAALDPSTGDGLWAVQLTGEPATETKIEQLAIGPTDERAIAIAWHGGSVTLGTHTLAPRHAYYNQAFALLDRAGGVRWARSVDHYAWSIVTDGIAVIAAGPEFFAQLSETGLDWKRPITGAGTHECAVHALAGGRLLASIFAWGDRTDHPFTAVTIDGDVQIDGDGLVLAEVLH